jgi:AmpD protein
VHFVLGENGELGKIGDPADRLRHAGASEWRGRTNCNNFLLGIEIVGVGQPNAKQFTKLTEFCKYLIGAFGRKSTDCFPRHAEIATPKGRKADISLDFF